jgi:hypothetical protein
MAVSGLEQRHIPLVVASSAWSPWGLGLTAPLDQSYPQTVDRLTIRRTQSWSDFATYAQIKHYMIPRMPGGELVYRERKDSSEEDPGTPTSVMSDPCVGRRAKKTKRKKLDPTMICQRAEVMLKPMLLGAKNNAPKIKPQQVVSNVEVALEEAASTEQLATLPKIPTRESIDNNNVTTLMIRNLPYTLTQQELLQALDGSGFAGLYDFFYLPHKFKEHKNLGFAFVNFLTPESAATFSNDWHHTFRFKMGSMHKPLNISAAAVQGRAANERAANSHKMGRVKNNFFRPVVMQNSLMND